MKKFLLLALLSFAFSRNLTAQVTYPDVAGIFYSRCTSCHHENQHAPSFMTYSEASYYGLSMKDKLQTDQMPPWHADTTYTRFLNERSITPAEKNSILAWISDGTLPGDTTLAPQAPTYPDPMYSLNGTPSLILQIPTFTSNANTSDAYNCFSLSTGLAQDVWLRAFEVIPGNPSIVHHCVTMVDTAGTSSSDLSGNCFSQPGDFDLGVWAPGAAPTIFPGIAPLKAGIRLKAGCKITIQIHYPAGTVGQKDSTQIRMYFYPLGTPGIREVYVSTLLQNWTMAIPANTVKTFTASSAVNTPMSVYAVGPHSHLVCTSMTVWADNGTTTIPFIRENNWDFNWQGFYTFPRMQKVPSGYTLRSSHVFDNTTNNINNPNSPPQLVTAGTSTKNEMLFDSFQYLDYQAGDENIDIGALLKSDPLITKADKPLSKQANGAGLYGLYPNPVTNEVIASYYIPGNGKGVFSIIDMEGRKVEQVEATALNGGLTNQRFSTTNLSPGVYMVKLTTEGATSVMKFTKF